MSFLFTHVMLNIQGIFFKDEKIPLLCLQQNLSIFLSHTAHSFLLLEFFLFFCRCLWRMATATNKVLYLRHNTQTTKEEIEYFNIYREQHRHQVDAYWNFYCPTRFFGENFFSFTTTTSTGYESFHFILFISLVIFFFFPFSFVLLWASVSCFHIIFMHKPNAPLASDVLAC